MKIVSHSNRKPSVSKLIGSLKALVIELNGIRKDELNTIKSYDIGDIRSLRVDAEYSPL